MQALAANKSPDYIKSSCGILFSVLAKGQIMALFVKSSSRNVTRIYVLFLGVLKGLQVGNTITACLIGTSYVVYVYWWMEGVY